MFELFRPSSPLWRNTNFNRLWSAQVLSAFGNRITRTGLPIIAVAVLAVGPGQAAVLAALSLAPTVLAGLLGGGIVERSNKLRLMMAMDLARFCAVITVPIAWYLDRLNFGLLCAVAVLLGLASALFANADVSILPRLVGKDELVGANSRLQSTESLAELAGPGAAGVLIDMLTAPFAIVVDALTFLWSAFWLFGVPRRVGQPAAASGSFERAHPLTAIRGDFAVGAKAIGRHPALIATNLAVFAFYLSAGSFGALYTLFMLKVLGLTPTAMGLIISVGGVSALIGSLTARPLARAIGFGPALVVGFAIALGGTLMLIPAAYSDSRATLFLVVQQLLGDAGFMIFTILATSLAQKLLSENEIARATGFSQVVAGVAMTVSILAAGMVADAIGVRATVVWAAGLGVLGLLPLLSKHLLAVRDEPVSAVFTSDGIIPETP